MAIQRRKDGSVDFHSRNWDEYEDGFGSLTEEFWFGLRGMHTLTNQEQWELRIDYIFPNTTKSHLSYSNFRVGSATEQYPLTISGFDGATTDPFSTLSLNGMKFTSRDKDNDLWEKNCAIHWAGGSTGGWWYRDCTHIPLNHLFHPNRKTAFLNGQWQRISTWEMKIRPKDCRI
ncbi:fibrinogen C domain-containing protein 1-like [Dysidea avara]|uniref:fibrinogen C domain-containing protein 1-like n=1 Tax=Dysidea avara TaxID=196820 RepID=UPI003330D084